MTEAAHAVITPHPITLDGQRFEQFATGETVQQFLARVASETQAEDWEVRINGISVPHEVMGRVRPKPGTVIEVRGVVGRQAMQIVAMVALTYFTFGAATTIGGMFAVSSGVAMAINIGVYIAGSALGGKVVR